MWLRNWIINFRFTNLVRPFSVYWYIELLTYHPEIISIFKPTVVLIQIKELKSIFIRLDLFFFLKKLVNYFANNRKRTTIC